MLDKEKELWARIDRAEAEVERLRKALAQIRVYVVDWGLEKDIHEIVDKALKEVVG